MQRTTISPRFGTLSWSLIHDSNKGLKLVVSRAMDRKGVIHWHQGSIDEQQYPPFSVIHHELNPKQLFLPGFHVRRFSNPDAKHSNTELTWEKKAVNIIRLLLDKVGTVDDNFSDIVSSERKKALIKAPKDQIINILKKNPHQIEYRTLK